MKKLGWNPGALQDMILRVLFVALLSGYAANVLCGQSCKDMEYGHQNQIDPKTIELRQVRGTAVDPSGHGMWQLCAGIFTEEEHKLVRYGQSDSNGVFVVDTNGLPDGKYRLVVQADGLCPANQQIRIKMHSRQKKSVVIHMEGRGIDSCSYVELSKK